MIRFAWFVRSVRMGDTHLCDADWDGLHQVRPVCDPAARFVPLNSRPLRELNYDDQPCTSCTTTLNQPQGRPRPTLVVTR